MLKIPLSKLLRIPKHRSKAIAWVEGVDTKHDCIENHTTKEDQKEKRKEVEKESSVSNSPNVFG